MSLLALLGPSPESALLTLGVLVISLVVAALALLDDY